MLLGTTRLRLLMSLTHQLVGSAAALLVLAGLIYATWRWF